MKAKKLSAIISLCLTFLSIGGLEISLARTDHRYSQVVQSQPTGWARLDALPTNQDKFSLLHEEARASIWIYGFLGFSNLVLLAAGTLIGLSTARAGVTGTLTK